MYKNCQSRVVMQAFYNQAFAFTLAKKSWNFV
jgi:hypothetical protein